MAFTFAFYTQFLTELMEELGKQSIEISSIHSVPVNAHETLVGYIIISFKRQVRSHGDSTTVYLDASGQARPHGLRRALYPNHELYDRIEEWATYVRNRFYLAERVKQIKEELVATAWHPDRVAKWVEAGVELEAM